MAGDSWPTPQDYNEAIQNPRACFSDPDLKNGIVDTNALGLPRAMTGAFASVYRINSEGKSWAVRCFLTSRLDQKDRYRHISDFVLFDDLDCTIDFHFVEQGINVKGKWYPCLKMPWVSGETLDVYLSRNYKTPGKIKKLLEEFHKMVDELERAGIGHGDLQHGNIIVTDAGIRLVDYDALYVPALLGRKSLELGHPNYQHPDRNEHHFDPDVDNFSCWLIHASLLALAIDPDLYDNFGGGDECILFRRTDLARPEESKLFEALLQHPSASIRDMTSILRRMLWAAPLSIPILDCPPEFFELLPNVRNEKPAPKPPEEAEQPAVGEQPAPPVQIQQSVYQQRNTFDFIDDEASIVQIGAKKKAQKTTSQKLKNLNQARIKLSEDMLMFFSPKSWVNQHMDLALQHFDNGNYDSALNTYLRVYKMMNKSDRETDTSFFWCLMGMGYCSALSDKTALAGNYFLLANKSATTDNTKARSGLCLAVIRYESGDEKGAMKLLYDIWKGNVDLPRTVLVEMKNVYIVRPSFFHLLRSFGENLLQSADPRALEVLSAARTLFGTLAKTNSIQMSEESAGSMLKLANLYRKQLNYDEAKSLYRDVGRAAIRTGVMTPGRNALFCAAVMDLGPTANAKAQRMQDLDLIVESFAQETNKNSFGARLRHMIGYSVETAPEPILTALTDLSFRFIEKQYRPQALVAAETAFKITIERQLALDAHLVSLIGALGEVDGWTCITHSYLGADQSLEPLISFLFSMKDIKTLKYIAQRLVDEDRMPALTAMLMHFAIYNQETFSNIGAALVADLKPTMRNKIFAAIEESGRRFLSNLDHLFDEQPSEASSAKKILDAQVEHLDAIAAVRSFLKAYGYTIEAQSISHLMMRLQNTQLLMVWMLKLIAEHQSERFIEFILDPIENDAASVSDFVLQLAMEETNNGVELFISSLRQWGLIKNKLESLLIAAAKLCCERLTSLLDIQPVEAEALTQLRALYRMKEIAIDLGVQRQFDDVSKALYDSDYFASLTTLMSALALTDESRLLKTMTVDMVEFDNENLFNTLSSMAIAQPDKAIIGMCKALIENGKSPLVVSIAQKVAETGKQDFFQTLSLLIVQELPAARVLELASELVKSDYSEGLAILIRQTKMLSKTDLLLRLLSKFSPQTKFDLTSDASQSVQADAINAMILLSNLTVMADQVHLAAMSGDRRLSNLLCDFDRHGLKDEQRLEVLKLVVYRCTDSLTEYYERSKNAEDPTGKLKILATLNVAALHRISSLLPGLATTNPAAITLQDEKFSEFVINWLLDLAGSGDLEKIAAFAVETAKYGNIELMRAIFLRMARASYPRALIVTSRKMCADGFSTMLVMPIKELAQNKLTDAFGSVSLEAVSNLTCAHTTLLSIVEGLSNCERTYLRVFLRQIFFYRGKEEVDHLYQDWSNSKENGDSLVMLDEMRALGYVS